MNKNSNLFKELSFSDINKIISEFFGKKITFKYQLMTGGLFNTTYRVEILDTNEILILRVGPINIHLLLPFEENLMKGERYAYSLCENSDVPCPEILKCDTSKKLITRDYMIVKFIDSKPLSEISSDEDIQPELYEYLGKVVNKLHKITNNKFGRAYDINNNKGFNSWSEFIINEFNDVKNRLIEFNLFNQDELDKCEDILHSNSNLLDEITVASLVHADLWAGNVLVNYKNNTPKLAAIIDMDRSLFGDPDFEFANQWITNSYFFKGYGVSDEISHKRVIRRKIYKLLYSLIDSYVWNIEYNNPKAFQDEKNNVLKTLNELLNSN